MKSYYEILNVKSDAKKSEIKNQYRKLVRMYHPDVNSSFEAEKIFKEINRAADILLDDTKRKKYDELRATTNQIYNSYNKSKENSSNYSYNDIFKTKNKKEKNKTFNIKNGDDVSVMVDISVQESILGCKRIINIAQSEICPKCHGHKFANLGECVYCKGKGEITHIRKITVKIPPSIKNKAKLRLKNEGKLGKNGGKNGNLYVIVNIKQDDDLIIKDNIVHYNAQISPYTAILGGNLIVPTLWGEATIKLPPLTKANQSFKLIGVGILDEKTNKKGDEIVNITIQIPSSLTDEEYFLYEKLKEINSKKKNATTIKDIY